MVQKNIFGRKEQLVEIMELLLLLLFLLKSNSWEGREKKPKSQDILNRSKKRLAKKRCILCLLWDRFFLAVILVGKQR